MKKGKMIIDGVEINGLLGSDMNNFTSDVTFNKSLLLGNEDVEGTIIKAKRTDGVYQNVFSMGGNNNLSIGAGLFRNKDKATYIYGGKNIFMILPVNDSSYGVVLQSEINDAAPTAFRPEVNEGTYLGLAAKKWHTIYAKTGTVNTSDEREKENIVPMVSQSVMTRGICGESASIDIYSELFDRLIPVEYNFINGDGRVCYGLIAQSVISALDEIGLGENELDLVHHDYYIDEETGEEKDTYGLNYNNLIALLIHEVQKLKAEVKELKTE